MTLREYTNMRRRSGFSLVEVLVSMALILFIMSILAGAFGAASQAVSDLKAAGDLAEKLRGATSVLKRDLEAPHFYDGTNGSSLIHLSDANFWDRLAAPNIPVGFFRIYQGAPDTNEGTDLDGLPSFVNPAPATPTTPSNQLSTALHYTIALHGTRRSDFLSASVPAGSPLLSTTDPLLGPPDERYQDSGNEYNSQYAEVAVFLAPAGTDMTDGTDGPAQQLYALYRRQFLTAPPGWSTPVTDTAPSQYLEVSTIPGTTTGTLTVNTMQDLTQPVRRFGMSSTAAQGVFASASGYPTMAQVNANFGAADLLMTDVLSFDVRVLLKGGFDFVDLYDPSVQAFSNKNTGFYPNPGYPMMAFDTWSNQGAYSTWATPGAATSVPLFQSGTTPISIQALQITLRVWDFKTKKTRQVTIVQQM